MPMCEPDCNCKWCRLLDMALHPEFSSRVDTLLAEYEEMVPLKPKIACLPDGFY